MVRQDNGSFAVTDVDGDRLFDTRPGELLSLPGVTLRLTPEARNYPELG